MHKLIDYLLAIGYSCIECPIGGYSSITPGGIQSVYKKDESFWYFGLHEKGHHPTLIYPRPTKDEFRTQNGESYFTKWIMSDSEISAYLNSKKPEEVYSELNNLSV